jgi:c-di-GMP-related signal transduction protein
MNISRDATIDDLRNILNSKEVIYELLEDGTIVKFKISAIHLYSGCGMRIWLRNIDTDKEQLFYRNKQLLYTRKGIRRIKEKAARRAVNKKCNAMIENIVYA